MMNLWKRLRAWLSDTGGLEYDAPADAPPLPAPRVGISASAIAAAGPRADAKPRPQVENYRPPPGVLPSPALAMDYNGATLDYLNQGNWGLGTFQGFPLLSSYAQMPEYRKVTEVIAEEMTRKWIRLTASGDGDKTERLAQLQKAMERYKVRDLFRTMAEYDGFYGRGQLFINVKTPSGGQAVDDELKTILVRAPAKITKGSLIGFRAVEPVWTYPGAYNSTNPLAPDFYKPTAWYVMGQTIHASRLLTFVGRPVPDLFKASYNFSGLSLSQLIQPYVDNWLRTRDSVSDVLHAFSTSGIMTDLGSVLTAGDAGGQLMDRMELFTRYRDNKGLMLLDKGTEEFFQFNTPLSSLDKLQAQAQEQQSTIPGIPLVKLFGITPSGLNASSDGEIRVFYDSTHAKQEAHWREPLTSVIEVIQLSEFGDIDKDISFEFLPLWQPDAVEAATIRKTDADTDAVLVGAGVITSDESRERLIHDPDNMYHTLESNANAMSIEEELEARAAALEPDPEPEDK